MGRNNNTFEKMQRERLKKQKADDKRARRQKKKEEADGLAEVASDDAGSLPDASISPTSERS